MPDPADPAPDLLARALSYAAVGVPVFPCAPGSKSPITAHGFHDATTDPGRVRSDRALGANPMACTPVESQRSEGPVA